MKLQGVSQPHSKRVRRRSQLRQSSNNPWFRLVLLGSSAFVAILMGHISDSNLITLTMIFLGCLATGLISEKTLVKILRRGR